MSYVIPGYYDEPTVAQPAERDLIFVPRWRHQWIAFILPAAMTGIGWLAGVQPLTDYGFFIFTCVCAVFLVMEFVVFPRRFGIGGLVLYGGTLCWFCQDYFVHWFNHDYNSGEGLVPFWVVSKAAFLHVAFVGFMSIGLNLKIGKWAERLLLFVPDPGNPVFYLVIVLTLFAFALSPYFLVNDEPIPVCLYHAVFAGWSGPPKLTVYRSGNLNYNWGGYFAQIIQVGELGGIVAIIYAIMIAPNWPLRFLGFGIWLFNGMIAFNSGRRGEIAFALLPPIAILFIKFQARAAMMFKKFSIAAYVVCGLLAVFLQFVVQFQGTFRGYEGGYNAADISKLDLTANQGNTMFSEGLLAYSLIGESMPYFYSRDFPGEGAIIALPKTAFDFIIGMIPRALWHDKPVDSLWAWYNQAYTGTGNGMEGTTISHGLIGSWYFKFGYIGMVEGALLVGWLMGVSERALQHSEGKPISIMMALGFAVWIFRDFRDFIFIDLYGLVLGGIALTIIIPLMRPLFGSQAAD